MISVKALASSSKGNAYLLESRGRQLLVECGITIKDLLNKSTFSLSGLSGCLVSHEHGDHARCVKDLAKRAVNIYASRGTLEAVGLLDHHRANKLSPNVLSTLKDGWTVIPFNAVHDSADPLSFIIRDDNSTLLFVTDSAYCKYVMPWPVDIIMIEANFSDNILQKNVDLGFVDKDLASRIRRNHMSIERVVELLAANDLSRLKKIHLLHLSDWNSDETLFKKIISQHTGVPVIVEGA